MIHKKLHFFDTLPSPSANSAGYKGAWGVYPYLPSGTLLVSDIDNGLFLLRERGREEETEEKKGGFQYATKLVCGVQKELANFRLARGFYATAINIHNPHNDNIKFSKKLALTFPPKEQQPGQVLQIATDQLRTDEALSVDCEDIKNKFPQLFQQTPYIKGFVVVQSNRSLDVTAVYTTADLNEQGVASTHSSIDVEHIQGHSLGDQPPPEDEVPRADLMLTKLDDPDPVKVNGTLSYSLTVKNAGPSDASGVVMVDTLPEAVRFVGVTPTSCREEGGVITCELGDLTKGNSTDVKIQVTALRDGIISNTAKVSGGQPDPDNTNNRISETTTVGELHELVVDGPPVSGSISNFREKDRFRFHVNERGTYKIETEGETNVMLVLYGPDNHKIEEDLNGADDGRNAKILKELGTGTYLVVVQHESSFGLGEYAVSVRTVQ